MNEDEVSPVSRYMETDVPTLYEGVTVGQGIAILQDARVSGAPVVNDSGECVGVFSIADLATGDDERPRRPRTASYFRLGFAEWIPMPAAEYDTELLDHATVSEWMSRELATIGPDTPIAEAARTMVEERVDRLLVVRRKKLVGVLTAFDILRLVSTAALRHARRRRAV